MIYRERKNYLIPISVVSVIVIFLVLNLLIDPVLDIKTYCQVYPVEEWVLTRGNNGQIISSMINYERGHTVQYSLNQFERGEFISLKFSTKLNNEGFISKGDTIASIASSEVEDQIISMIGDLDVAKANLKTQNTGQKESMIQEAENRLKYTEEKIKEQKVLTNRISALYAKGLSSEAEFETQKWALDLLEIEKQIYKSELENISTGVKKEEKDLIESRINSIKARLSFLKNRENNLTIISPLSGYAANIFSADTLLKVINNKEIILKVPVKVEDIDLIKKGETLKVNVSDLEKEFSGLIVSISHEVKFLNNRQVVFVSVKMDNVEEKLLPGMVKEISLKIKQIKFYNYIERFFTT